MKVLWCGSVYSPTGFGKHSREMIKALDKAKIPVQCDDFYVPRDDIGEGLAKFNKPILQKLEDINETITVINDYPNRWDKGHGIRFAYLIHEGSKLPDEFVHMGNNMVDGILVPSKATKNLAKWNGIRKPIYIVPEGVNPDFYYPTDQERTSAPFKFLFVGSWIGELVDRKGAGLVMKAFNEEFRDENVELQLKLSTFWAPKFDVKNSIFQVIGEEDNRIKFNQDPLKPEDVRKLYWDSDCFVMPTQGEAFGLTIAEAMACGIPTIVTNDRNSGHMDYTKDYVTYVEWKKLINADKRFHHPDNTFPLPDKDDLRKKMREVYENYKEKKKKALEGSDFIRKEFSWDKSVEKLKEVAYESQMSKLQE